MKLTPEQKKIFNAKRRAIRENWRVATLQLVFVYSMLIGAGVGGTYFLTRDSQEQTSENTTTSQTLSDNVKIAVYFFLAAWIMSVGLHASGQFRAIKKHARLEFELAERLKSAGLTVDDMKTICRKCGPYLLKKLSAIDKEYINGILKSDFNNEHIGWNTLMGIEHIIAGHLSQHPEDFEMIVHSLKGRHPQINDLNLNAIMWDVMREQKMKSK